MSTVHKRLSPQEYLVLERQLERRHEYLDGEMFAMSGASYEHTVIKDNLLTRATIQLEKGPCRILSTDQRVKVDATGLFTYPDLTIICGEPEFEDSIFETLVNPQVIIEVLSESTEKYDRGGKFNHYQQIPSLQEYVLIAQDRLYIERHVRQADGTWDPVALDDPAGTFAFATVPVQIPIAEIYAGVRASKMKGPGPWAV